MKKLLIILAIIIVIIFGGLALLGWNQIRAGISAHEEPTALEEVLARTMRSLATPESAKELENPLEKTEAVLASARAHWADHCAQCHGNDGMGETEMGRGLYPPAPDMTAEQTQSLTDGELAYIIRNGIRLTGMPAWGEPGTPPSDSDWELVLFIRHLPDVTPEELEEMEGMNPVSPHALKEAASIEEFLSGETGSPDSDSDSDTPPAHGEPGHHH